jgi:hypothetical protein
LFNSYRNDLWRPLDSTKSEIRVIEISPAEFRRDVIVCYLRTVSLLNKPEYEALSYVWGDTRGKKHILVDGNRIPVTKSLFAALECLRDAEKTRILWIDALCINQTNDTEKNIQVAMMGTIYSQASKVLVWLLNSELLGLLDDISSRSQNPEAHFTELPSWFITLSDNGWWHRAWTFQEAVLADKLIFHTGQKCFSIENLEQYCNSIERHLFQQDSCCSAIFDNTDKDPENKCQVSKFLKALNMTQNLLSNRRIIFQGEKSLLDLILNNRYRLATKPQDRVYAYLGLACDAPSELVKYELSLRDWNLHISTKLILQHSMSLKIVALSSRSGYVYSDMCRMGGLPSWCPDWTLSMEASEIYIMQELQKYVNAPEFAASRRTKANLCFPAPEVLGVSGVVCDTVTHVEDGIKSPRNSDDNLQVLHQWYRLIANNTSVHNVRCGNCNKLIYGIRKKCLTCSDFNFCCRCFGKSKDIHLGHPFSSIQSPEIDTNDKENGYIVKDFNWKRLSEIAYPFGDSSTLQDAFRNVITTEGNLNLLFTQNNHVIDGKTTDVLLMMAFAKFWHLKIENRLEADFVIEGCTIKPGILASSVLAEDSMNYISQMVQTVLRRKVFFMSSKGYIGWGPIKMKVGDTIAVLHGGDMPFVLRQVPEKLSGTDASSGYTVIGECYASGLMRGEALENDQMEKRDFLLY